MGLVMDIMNMKQQQNQYQEQRLEQINQKKQEVAYKKADMGIQMMSGGDKTPLPIRQKGMQLFRNSLEVLYPDEDFSSFDKVNIQSKEGSTFLKQVEAQAEKIRKKEAHPDSMLPILAAGYAEYEDNKVVDVYADWTKERGKQKPGDPVKGLEETHVIGPKGSAISKPTGRPTSFQKHNRIYKDPKSGKPMVQPQKFNPKVGTYTDVGDPYEADRSTDFLGQLLGLGQSGMEEIQNPPQIEQGGPLTQEESEELKALRQKMGKR